MSRSHVTLRPDDRRRCPENEWRLVRFRHSVVRTLVQCGLVRGHEGPHTAARIVFGVKTVP